DQRGGGGHGDGGCQHVDERGVAHETFDRWATERGPSQVEEAPGAPDVHHRGTDRHIRLVDRRDGVVEVGSALVGSEGANELDGVSVDSRTEGVVEAVGDEEDPGRHGAPCQHRRVRSSTIAVDARRLGEGSAYRGIGTYLRNLLAGLLDVDGIDVKALATPGTPLPPGVTRVPLHRRADGRLLTLEHDVRLPRDLRRSGATVAHSPALDPPRRSPVPWVQTVHDLIPLAFDDDELDIERQRWRRYGPRLLRAAAVVTPSQHSADQAVAALGLD